MNDAELQTLIKLLKNNKLYFNFNKQFEVVFGCKLGGDACKECLLNENNICVTTKGSPLHKEILNKLSDIIPEELL